MYRAYRTAINTNSQLTITLALAERERERGMDPLASTKPGDHKVVSPARVLLHLSILPINMVSHFLDNQAVY